MELLSTALKNLPEKPEGPINMRKDNGCATTGHTLKKVMQGRLPIHAWVLTHAACMEMMKVPQSAL